MGKNVEKCHPLGAAPPPIFSNTVNYLISLAITNEYRWNFQELVQWLGEEKWTKIILKYITHLGLPRQPQPPNSKTGGISANYEPISTQFSEISVPTC